MIELLGVGVRHRYGGWLVRNVCARLDAGELTLVVSPRPDERRALIEAVAGDRVPDEGRVWVNHVPLLRATARRLRGLCGLVELPGRLVGERSILWNALAPTRTVRALGGILRLPRRRDRDAVDVALERVGLCGRAHEPAAVLACGRSSPAPRGPGARAGPGTPGGQRARRRAHAARVGRVRRAVA